MSEKELYDLFHQPPSITGETDAVCHYFQINLVLHEYLHNEYRRSFVEFHFKLCDMINSDPYVGAMVANVGITCPVPPKLQHLVNMTVPSTVNFKFKWPFKKCMAQVEFALTSTGESMAMGNFYLTFADKKFQL
ncbi:uncharacterized protein LOC114356930 [Ostrinia furnacalis]|uniref:uncharacterized protein LOC114356930 n=1 Tax=Ostrinia furnacalis TaxID=93504 RepID=UPI001039BD90|nr:uncharacterized protein LOC114356930 [Ostrinia furnacalis]